MTEVPPSNFPFLFAAFAVTWVIFFVYAFFISRRREELQREVRELRDGAGEDSGPAGPE